mmetsp:Transcript_7110/g.17954  ORF Transcript_7110/g.17954 Transcript_7110/m.17954 type:complete len:561 (+) Transcript_7110:182-1864(+)
MTPCHRPKSKAGGRMPRNQMLLLPSFASTHLHALADLSTITPTNSLQGLHRLLDLLLAVVVLVLELLRDLLQQLLREDAQQGPGDVQGREDVAVLVCALRQKFGLELVRELQVLVLVLAQRLLTNDSLHGARVLADGVVGVELVGDVGVVCARHALADAGLHQAAEGRQHVDGRVDLPVVQRPVHEDLAFGDVAREVRDGVSDVVVGHGQDRELRDGAVAALDAAGALVDRGQVRVHVAGVAAAAGHLLACGRNLAQGVRVGGHVREDHEDVLLPGVRKVLRRGQRQARRHDALDRRVVGQVQEEHDVLHGAVLLEVVAEEACRLHVHTHGAEDDAEVIRRVVQHVLALDQRGLTADLRRDLVVRQARGREEGQLLATHHGVHGVDSTDARLDHLLGVDARLRVQRRAVDVQVILCQHRGSLVNGLARAVEGTAHEVVGDGHLQSVARKLDVAVPDVDVAGALEDLHDGLLLVDLQDLALPHGAVRQVHVDNLAIGRELDVVHDHKRALDADDGPVVDAWVDPVVPRGRGRIDGGCCCLRHRTDSLGAPRRRQTKTGGAC